MANPQQAVFLSGDLMRHVVRMSLTSSIGLMAMFAVDFVDMIFMAMLGNSELAAAVGYAGTLLFFTNSVNIGLSIAAGSLVSRSLGAGMAADGRRYATNVGIFSLLTGVALAALVLIYQNAILGWLGAEGEVQRLAGRYVSIILPTMVAMGLAMTAMAVLRAYGDARRSMLATLYGGAVNAVLDPLFIFGLGWGLDGAAIASVIARLVMLALSLGPAIRVHDAFGRPHIAPLTSDFRVIGAIALPAVLANIATPVGNAIVTREIARFGTDAVAGITVIGRLMPVAFAVIFALSGRSSGRTSAPAGSTACARPLRPGCALPPFT
ncbi:MAG: MATE family efflux transporter [Paracoccus sp. (in: a-proteobacteria)]|nr:MATE family efflux transporter [Paracoccus sp. (in: a-proteobacteria)]